VLTFWLHLTNYPGYFRFADSGLDGCVWMIDSQPIKHSLLVHSAAVGIKYAVILHCYDITTRLTRKRIRESCLMRSVNDDTISIYDREKVEVGGKN
jgi:hypothetical protein